MQEPHFLIYSSGYNCGDYVEKCLRSVESQTLHNYTHVVVDDGSQDDTWLKIQRFKHHRMVAHRNAENQKWTKTAVQYLRPEDEDIVVILDMDDYLACNTVLETLRKTYGREQCWLTYGNVREMEQLPKSTIAKLLHRCMGGVLKPKGRCRKLPDHILERRAFRETNFRTTHLRTFKGFLWNAIHLPDVLDWNGQYPPMAGDVAVTLPMLDMCAPGKIVYIPDVLYVYNYSNPLNDDKISRELQERLELWYRQKPRYPVLERRIAAADGGNAASEPAQLPNQ